MPKISVIVPVYNRESCLGWCVSSILAQTFRDFEVILVDDGSTDASLSICRNYAALDPRVHVFSKPNGGVSTARNLGLQQAAGEYIQFIDSDDWIPPQMLEKLLASMEQYEADIVFCDIKQVKLPLSVEVQYTLYCNNDIEQECAWNRKMFWDRLAYLFWTTSYMEGPCNRLYKKSLIEENKLRFPEDMHYGEDCMFNLQYYDSIQRAVFLKDLYYYYIQQSSSSLSICSGQEKGFFENQMRQVLLMLSQIKKNCALTAENYLCWCNYCVGQTLKVLNAVEESAAFLTLAEKEHEIEKIIRDNEVRAAAQDCNICDGRLCDIKNLIVNGSAKDILKYLEEQREKQLRAVSSNPGRVNQYLVKLMRLLQKLPSLSVKKLARIVELNLLTVGVKTTCKRILCKIFRKQKNAVKM